MAYDDLDQFLMEQGYGGSTPESDFSELDAFLQDEGFIDPFETQEAIGTTRSPEADDSVGSVPRRQAIPTAQGPGEVASPGPISDDLEDFYEPGPSALEDSQVIRTKLDPEEEAMFQQWYQGWRAVMPQLGEDPDDLGHKYDFRGAFQAGEQGEPQVGEDGQYHWPDGWKDEDHPTSPAGMAKEVARQALPYGSEEPVQEEPETLLGEAPEGVQDIEQQMGYDPGVMMEDTPPEAREAALSSLEDTGYEGPMTQEALRESIERFTDAPDVLLQWAEIPIVLSDITLGKGGEIVFDMPEKGPRAMSEKGLLPEWYKENGLTGRGGQWRFGLELFNRKQRLSNAGMIPERENIQMMIDDLKKLEAVGQSLHQSEGWVGKSYDGFIQSLGPMVQTIIVGKATGSLGTYAMWQQEGAGSIIYEYLKDKDVENMSDEDLERVWKVAQTGGAIYSGIERVEAAFPKIRGFGGSIGRKFIEKITKGIKGPKMRRAAREGLDYTRQTVAEVGEEIAQEVEEKISVAMLEGDEFGEAASKAWNEAKGNLKKAEFYGSIALMTGTGRAYSTLVGATDDAQEAKLRREIRRLNNSGRKNEARGLALNHVAKKLGSQMKEVDFEFGDKSDPAYEEKMAPFVEALAEVNDMGVETVEAEAAVLHQQAKKYFDMEMAEKEKTKLGVVAKEAKEALTTPAKPGETEDRFIGEDVIPESPSKGDSAVISGMPINIETPAGDTRTGTAADGTKWETEMKHHYGSYEGTAGADGEPLDVFVNPEGPADPDKVHLIHQKNPETGEFDEYKVMSGFDSSEAAADAYEANYDAGWEGLDRVEEIPMDEFKERARAGEFAKTPKTRKIAKRVVDDLGESFVIDPTASPRSKAALESIEATRKRLGISELSEDDLKQVQSDIEAERQARRKAAEPEEAPAAEPTATTTPEGGEPDVRIDDQRTRDEGRQERTDDARQTVAREGREEPLQQQGARPDDARPRVLPEEVSTEAAPAVGAPTEGAPAVQSPEEAALEAGRIAREQGTDAMVQYYKSLDPKNVEAWERLEADTLADDVEARAQEEGWTEEEKQQEIRRVNTAAGRAPDTDPRDVVSLGNNVTAKLGKWIKDVIRVNKNLADISTVVEERSEAVLKRWWDESPRNRAALTDMRAKYYKEVMPSKKEYEKLSEEEREKIDEDRAQSDLEWFSSLAVAYSVYRQRQRAAGLTGTYRRAITGGIKEYAKWYENARESLPRPVRIVLDQIEWYARRVVEKAWKLRKDIRAGKVEQRLVDLMERAVMGERTEMPEPAVAPREEQRDIYSREYSTRVRQRFDNTTGERISQEKFQEQREKMINGDPAKKKAPEAPLSAEDVELLDEALDQISASGRKYREAVVPMIALDRDTGQAKIKDEEQNDGSYKRVVQYKVAPYRLQQGPKSLPKVPGVSSKKSVLEDYAYETLKLKPPKKPMSKAQLHKKISDVYERRQQKLKESYAKKLADEVIREVARPEIAAASGWYAKMRAYLQRTFGASIEMFSQLLGATSARTDVDSNFDQTVEAMQLLGEGRYDELLQEFDAHVKETKRRAEDGELEREWRANPSNKKKTYDPADEYRKAINAFKGVPTRRDGQKFNMNSRKVLHAIYGNWLSQTVGPKTPNFAGNLSGRTTAATIDVWAARMLRRLIHKAPGKKWRILPASESGVAFTLSKEGVYGGDFVYAQEIFDIATAQINDALGTSLNADDVQALAWFIEKDVWDKAGWTGTAGAKKSSFEEGAGRLVGERFTAGITTYKSDRDYSEETQQRAIKSIREAIKRTPDVIASRVNMSKGLYDNTEEPSIDLEFTINEASKVRDALSRVQPEADGTYLSKKMMDRLKSIRGAMDEAKRLQLLPVLRDSKTFNPSEIEALLDEKFNYKADLDRVTDSILRVAKQSRQTDAFVSEVVDSEHPNARPMVEVGFKSPISQEEAQKVTKIFKDNKVDGFTLATDRQGNVIGFRAQYIPEISARYGASDTKADVEDMSETWLTNIDNSINLLDKSNVSYASQGWVSTVVYGRGEYDGPKYDSRTTDIQTELRRRRLLLSGQETFSRRAAVSRGPGSQRAAARSIARGDAVRGRPARPEAPGAQPAVIPPVPDQPETDYSTRGRPERIPPRGEQREQYRQEASARVKDQMEFYDFVLEPMSKDLREGFQLPTPEVGAPVVESLKGMDRKFHINKIAGRMVSDWNTAFRAKTRGEVENAFNLWMDEMGSAFKSLSATEGVDARTGQTVSAFGPIDRNFTSTAGKKSFAESLKTAFGIINAFAESNHNLHYADVDFDFPYEPSSMMANNYLNAIEIATEEGMAELTPELAEFRDLVTMISNGTTYEELQEANKAAFDEMINAGATVVEGGEVTQYPSMDVSIQDAEYMSAVDAGDTETAQQMVDEAAAAAGAMTGPGETLREFYHGTMSDQPIDVFVPGDESSGMIWFSSNRDTASASGGRGQESRSVVKAYIIGNQQDFVTLWADDYRGVLGVDVDREREVIEKALEENPNAIGVRWIYEAQPFMEGQEVYAVRPDKNIIKSADPVTRDSEGNVIPLSQRFDETRPEITYQTRTPGTDTMSTRAAADSNFSDEELPHGFGNRVQTDVRLDQSVRDRIQDTYLVRSNKETVGDAMQRLNNYGSLQEAWAGVQNESNNMPGETRTALAFSLMQIYNEKAVAEQDTSPQQHAYLDKAVEIGHWLNKWGEKNARTLQAFSIWDRLLTTPAGAQRYYVSLTQQHENKLKDDRKDHVKNMKAAVDRVNAETIENPKILKMIDKKVNKILDSIIRGGRKLFNRRITGSQYDSSKVEEKLGGSDLNFATRGPKISEVNEPEWLERAMMVGSVLMARDKIVDQDEWNVKMKALGGSKVEPYLASLYKRSMVYTMNLPVKGTGKRDRNDRIQELTGSKVLDILRQHYTDAEAAQSSLEEKLLASGMDSRDAKELADSMTETFQALAKGRKEQLLKEYQKRDGLPMNKRDQRAAGELMELSNLGVLRDSDYWETLVAKYNLPRMDAKIAQDLNRMAQEANAAPEGFQREEKIREMQIYIHDLQGMDAKDLVASVWYSHMLSALETHTRNIVGNMGMAMDPAILAGTKIVKGKPGQAWKIVSAYIQGMKGGLLDATEIIFKGSPGLKYNKKYEISSDTLELLNDRIKKLPWWNPAHILRMEVIPRRGLEAMDIAFFKANQEAFAASKAMRLAEQAMEDGMTRKDFQRMYDEHMLSSSEKYEQAKAKARSEGIKNPITLRRRAFEIMEQSREAEVMEEAAFMGSKMTYTNKPEGLLGGLANSMASAPGLLVRPIVPFLNTPANVANAMLDYIPHVAAYRLYRGMRTGKGEYREIKGDERTILKAKIAVSLAAGAYLLSQTMKDDDEEDKWLDVTGEGPTDRDALYQWKRTGREQFSIGVKNPVTGKWNYWSYKYHPAAMMLSLVGGYNDAVKYNGLNEKDLASRIALAHIMIPHTIYNQSFLSGLSDINKMMEADDMDQRVKQAGKWVGRTGSTVFVPNFIKKVYSYFDPKVYDGSSIERAILREFPVVPMYMGVPMYNVFGEQIKKKTFAEAVFRVKRDEDHKPSNLVVEKQAWISRPRINQTTIHGYSMATRPEVFAEYVRIRGEMISEYLTKNYDNLMRKDNETVQNILKDEIGSTSVNNPGINKRAKRKIYNMYLRGKEKTDADKK